MELSILQQKGRHINVMPLHHIIQVIGSLNRASAETPYGYDTEYYSEADED